MSDNPMVRSFLAVRKSQEFDLIAAALVKAQAQLSAPPRNRTVTVEPRSGRGYEFAYTTLDALIEFVRGPLLANDLWFIQLPTSSETGKSLLTTVLFHSSGQWIEGDAALLVEEATNQKYGSALTYIRRNSLAAVLGLASETDDDANAADGNEVVASAPRTPSKPRTERKIAPATVAAPVDASGTAGPHKIPMGTDAAAWGALFVAGIKSATSADEVSEWERFNAEGIIAIDRASAILGKALQARIKEAYDRVRKEAA